MHTCTPTHALTRAADATITMPADAGKDAAALPVGTTPGVTDVEGAAELGAAAAGEGQKRTANSTFHAVRKVVQRSTIWRVLNYGMNYDIHKV
jgi:hypothetical protein